MIPVLANVLQPLIDVSEAILHFWHDEAGLSWGVSIIGLTFVVRLAILPLTYKGLRGMHEMQRHAPEMQKMKEKYGDDRQKLNEEMMRFYKEHNFNPLSSCLPLLLQIPFFIALFYLLRGDDFRRDIEGEESFLFIPNLAAPLLDHVPSMLILLILYGGTQVAASAVTAVTAEKMQRLIMLVGLPILLVVFAVAYNFNTGLMVYWITTNVWTIGQQLVVRKFMPSPALQLKKAEAEGGGDGDAGASAKKKAKRGAAPQPVAAGAGEGARGSLFGGLTAAARGDSGGGQGGAAATAKPSGKSAGNGRANGGGTAKEAGGTKPRSGAGNGGPRKPPPASPRRKKKRSGRRR